MKKLRLRINSISHQIYSWGHPENPKLFFLHGWMDTGASFEFVNQQLSKDFYCIALDFRGFGKSSHCKNDLGYFFYEYLSDIHQFLLHYSPRTPVHLLGHSMGGNLASMYAGIYPERVKTLINVEGFGIKDMDPALGPKRIRQWIDEKTPSFKKYHSLKDLALRFKKTNPRLPMKRALFLAKEMSKKYQDGYIIRADPLHKKIHPYLFRLDGLFEFWKKITAQCLLIYAEHTEMGSWMGGQNQVQKEIKRRLKFFPQGSQQVKINDCGHMIHHEKPEELASAILQFLK